MTLLHVLKLFGYTVSGIFGVFVLAVIVSAVLIFGDDTPCTHDSEFECKANNCRSLSR